MDAKDVRIPQLHEQACADGKEFYIDPETGYQVFTELYHLSRGHCCNSDCRHCPWKKNEQKNEDDK